MTVHQMALPVTLGPLVFNTFDDTTGLQSSVDVVDGWLGSTKPTLAPTQKPRGHGSWSVDSYLSNRPISLSGLIVATSESSLHDAISALNVAHGLGYTQFSAYFAGSLKTSMVRTISEPIINPVDRLSVEWTSQLVADDPRKYGSVIPVSPIAVGGNTTITNDGDIDSPIYFRVSGGAVTMPSVIATIIDPFSQILFVMASTYTLPSGHTLDISTVDHTVYE